MALNMVENRFLTYQRANMKSGALLRDELAHKLTMSDLPTNILATILSHALPDRRQKFTSSILNTAKMFKKTLSARPAPSFLLVNKRFLTIGKQVWLQTDFAHIYMNSWKPLHEGVLSSASTMTFVVLTLDVRRGDRSLNEKLVPSAFGAKLRELLQQMGSLEVLLIRVWHGIGSLGPVSQIIMNNFAGVRVKQAINIVSIVSIESGIDDSRGVPGLLSDFYMRNFVSHLLHVPIRKVSKPTTQYLDDSEPSLKIPVWRACSETCKTATGYWMPAVDGRNEPEPEFELEADDHEHTEEEQETLTQLYKACLKKVPWVKAALRVGKRQEKAKMKRAAVEEAPKVNEE